MHKYVGGKPTQTVEDTLGVIDFVRGQYVDYGIGRWAIIEKQTGDFVGWTGFKMMTERVNNHVNFYDFGYRLTRSKWQQGFGYEAALSSLAYGIEKYGFTDIYAMTDPDNAGSRRILEKLGFELKEIFNYDASPTWRQQEELTTWYKFAGFKDEAS